MLLILTPAETERLKYILELVFSKILGMEFRLTVSQETYAGWKGPKMAYGADPVADGVYIASDSLLFETSILRKDWEPSTWQDMPVIIPTRNPASGLPFDPLAASFLMVTRYEEYLSFKKDKYGRFPATASIAWQGKFLEKPVVHLWAGALYDVLKKAFPELQRVFPQYRFIPTIDVDHAWSYRGRSFRRTAGGFMRSLVNGRFSELTARFRVLTGMMTDPYDTYDYIKHVHSPMDQVPLFFILFADYGRSDNNVNTRSKNFHQLLRKLDSRRNVGIHPSLSSNKHLDKLEDEYHGLSAVLGRRITASRQHFLRISMPKTYRVLVQMGIAHDYSMGYAGHPGFRAGIALPFLFFDLHKNEVTGLTIHPVTVMDVTLKDYLRLNSAESLKMIGSMISTVRSVNGEFVSLWHNESLSDAGRWRGWRPVYEEMVRLATPGAEL